MTDTKFTPGPWEVTEGVHTETTETYDKGDKWFNVNGEDGVIADVLFGRCLVTDEDDAKANAALIAAAPEMFEALQKLRDWVGKLTDWTGEDPPCEVVDAAIKKAHNPSI